MAQQYHCRRVHGVLQRTWLIFLMKPWARSKLLYGCCKVCPVSRTYITHILELQNTSYMLNHFIYSLCLFYRDKAALALTSIFNHAHFEKNETFHAHFVCDTKSREFIEEFLKEHIHDPGFLLKVG